jgi:hypothetical protein
MFSPGAMAEGVRCVGQWRKGPMTLPRRSVHRRPGNDMHLLTHPLVTLRWRAAIGAARRPGPAA